MAPDLSIDELVAVNSLLIQRETVLADLSHLEATISGILGQPFPFEPPIAIPPSTLKSKPAKARKEPKPASPPRIRRLRPGEIGYRLSLVENGVPKTHDLLDLSPFQDLLASPLPHLRVVSIGTLDAELQTVDSLFG